MNNPAPKTRLCKKCGGYDWYQGLLVDGKETVAECFGIGWMCEDAEDAEDA